MEQPPFCPLSQKLESDSRSSQLQLAIQENSTQMDDWPSQESLVRCPWPVAAQNAALHDPDQCQQQIALKELQAQITEEHMRGIADLPKRDQFHFRTPLLTVLNKCPSHQKSWLKNVTAARNFKARKTTQVNDPLASSTRRTGIEQWMITKKLDL